MLSKTEKEPVQLVPQRYPYGSITDGDWVCTRCGESITGCALCAGEVISLTRIKGDW